MTYPVASSTPAHKPTSSHGTELDVQHQLCQDFWFPDGNIIVLAGACVFKIHRGQLERHSDVFKDMFSMPQPKMQSQIYGLPFIELYDSASDVYYLMKALYDGLYLKKPMPREFPFLAGVLRLSTKYLLESLRDICIAYLQRDFPLTLEDWDKREKAVTDPNARYSPRDSIPNPILVINLARELSLHTILPAAFYDLARYGTSKTALGTVPYQPIFPPVEAVPPPSAVLTSDATPTPTDTIRSNVFLSHEDLVTTFRGREAAQRSIAAFVSKELAERPLCASCAHKDDEDGRQCHESFYFITLNTLRSVGGIASGRDADPLFTLLQTIDMLHRTDFSDGERLCGLRLCCFCKLDFASAVNRARAELWKEIPAWFDLEDFEKLQKGESQGKEGWCLV